MITNQNGMEPPPQWMIDMPAGSPETYYWPGLWQPPNSSGFFRLGYWPKDSFVISWVAYNSEPEIGYPYHYGTVRGISGGCCIPRILVSLDSFK